MVRTWSGPSASVSPPPPSVSSTFSSAPTRRSEATRRGESLVYQSSIPETIVPMATAVLISDTMVPSVSYATPAISRELGHHGSTTIAASMHGTNTPPSPQFETIVETDEEEWDEAGTESAVVSSSRRSPAGVSNQTTDHHLQQQQQTQQRENAPTRQRSRRSMSMLRSEKNDTTKHQRSLSRDEKQFWITVIGVAICLNTLLAVGIVVGVFCASGSCQSTGQNLSTIPQLPVTKTPVSVPPTASPSRERQQSASPSSSSWPNVTIAVANPAESAPALVNATLMDDMQIWNGTTSSPSQETVATTPPSTEAPPEDDDQLPGADDTRPPAGRVREATLSPTSSPQPPINRAESTGLRIAGTALALEALIVVSLYVYYRRWKSKRNTYV